MASKGTSVAMWYDDLILSRSDGSIVSPAQVLAVRIACFAEGI